MQAVSDEQLIEWVANGDSSCLGTLFERHHRGVYRFCLQMTRNPESAEDVVQEVFINVLRKARSFRHDGTFKAWLFNIARNAALGNLRKNKRHAHMAPLDEHAESLLVDHQSAELAAEGAQKINLLQKALDRLPGHFQEVIWLGRFEFANFEELAQALDCKPGTARVRMHRAMQQLNVAYAQLNGDSLDV
ncbi:MAG: RNA polymerase sigma factor [Lysobacterales bacterium]